MRLECNLFTSCDVASGRGESSAFFALYFVFCVSVCANDYLRVFGLGRARGSFDARITGDASGIYFSAREEEV